MAILDDLKGILGDDAIAKIEANAALKAKISRGDELRGYYDGDEEVTPPARAAEEPAPARREPPAAFDLGAIERMLDTKLGKVNEIVDARVDAAVKTRGDELVNNAVKIALQRSDELNRIYMEHQSNYGEAFDTTKFNEFLESNKDKGFRSIRQGYDAYIAPRAVEREVDTKVKAKLAEGSGRHVPGTTPPPSTNSNIRFFKQRSAAGDGTASTGAQRAAALLDKRLAEAQSA